MFNFAKTYLIMIDLNLFARKLKGGVEQYKQ